uniref:UDP-glycosyltransferase 216A1 n=1 Tax=Strigamia maritima TaxID=126957 RepID=A0A023R9K0_STRMM|nr:UDP-glycosyltransferase 216A1 [Strigamia maritima]
MFCKSILAFLSILCVANSSKILFMSLFRTHWHLFFDLGHLLEEKQHEIYFLSYQNDSAFQKQNFSVYVVRPDLNLSLDSREFNEYVYQDLNLENANTMTTLNALADWCSIFLNDSTLFNQVQTQQFDIFITDLFVNDICSIAWAKKLAIPIIGIWPLSLSLPISYHLDVPTMNAIEYSSSTFFQRVGRIVQDYSLMKKWNANYYQPVLSVINKYYKESTNINALHEELVLIMTNENPILELDKPALSNIVSLGGFHCKSPNPIPKHVDDVSKRFRSGIIFVSLDFELSKMHKEVLMKTFFTLSSYAIIWQQREKMDENIPNILTLTNINQQDILGNPRTRLFVSSCDSHETTSAIFHSVPILCITKNPQNTIGVQVVDRKIGLQIPIDHLTRNSFIQNMNKLLTDKSYYQSVRQLSLIFRDQPEIPSDRFIFWIERIIRLKSAPLQVPKIRMYSSLYHYILDVIILIVIFSMVVIGVVILISFIVAKLLRSKSKGKVE